MPSEVAKIFLQYGLLGAIALAAGYWAYRKDREAKLVAEACQERIDKQVTDHQTEMAKLADRYITKAESWAARYEDFARELKGLIDSLRRSSAGGG